MKNSLKLLVLGCLLIFTSLSSIAQQHELSLIYGLTSNSNSTFAYPTEEERISRFGTVSNHIENELGISYTLGNSRGKKSFSLLSFEVVFKTKNISFNDTVGEFYKEYNSGSVYHRDYKIESQGSELIQVNWTPRSLWSLTDKNNIAILARGVLGYAYRFNHFQNISVFRGIVAQPVLTSNYSSYHEITAGINLGAMFKYSINSTNTLIVTLEFPTSIGYAFWNRTYPESRTAFNTGIIKLGVGVVL